MRLYIEIKSKVRYDLIRLYSNIIRRTALIYMQKASNEVRNPT